MSAFNHLPTLIHHMGALDDAPFPRNSLETIRASLDAGAAVIEIDITALSADDYLLVHDPVLESETSGAGPVAACTPAAARALCFKGTSYAVPLLSDVVALFRERGGKAQLQLDFKDAIPAESDEPMERLLRLIEPLGPRVIVSTGADWQLRRLRRLAAWLTLGFDVQYYMDPFQPDAALNTTLFPRNAGAYGYYDDHPLAAERFQSPAAYLRTRCEGLVQLLPDAYVFYLSYPLVLRGLEDGFNWAEELHRYNILLDVWTLDAHHEGAAAHLRRLCAAGVDFVTTNTPRALQEMLNADLRGG